MLNRARLARLFRKFEREFRTHNNIEVSGRAILHNLQTFEKLSGKRVVPVLKGNAYGHGIEIVGAALDGSGVPYIAVDGYFEALRLREVTQLPVLIMGAILPENYPNLRYDRFTFVVQDRAAIEGLAGTGRTIKVHLECNTGMNRYGADPGEVTALVKLILRHKNLQLEGVMSHLADSDGADPATVESAVKLFDKCVELVLEAGARPTIFHVAQSAGSLRAVSKYANAIRLGIGLYGVNPFPLEHELYATMHKALRPALSLTSTITHVIQLQKGDRVSYNYTFTAPRDMKIGVLPLGYFEGVNRSLSNSGVVKVGRSYAPIVGRVCMNHTMISLEGRSSKVGDRVVVISDSPGDENSIDGIAREHGLFSYNLLTALSPDVRRLLKK